MAQNKTYTVKYRRKQEGKTDYKQRRKLIDSGKVRITVRRMLNSITVQFIEFVPKGDKVLTSVCSKELAKDYGWTGHGGNIASAYLVGYLCGLKSKVKIGVLDIGLASPIKGSAFFAAARGLIDAKINVSCSEKVMPSMDRIERKGLKPETFSKHFEETKKKIEAKWKK